MTVAGTAPDVLDLITDEEPLDGHDGRSGARIARARLEGLAVVVKRVSRDDPMLELTGDDVGRELALWSSGALDKVGNPVGHAIIAGGIVGNEYVTVMRDLGATVVGWRRLMPPSQVLQLVRSVSAVHRQFVAAVPAVTCSLERRLTLFAAHRAREAVGSPLSDSIRRGWERFDELVDDDIRSAVERVHRDPAVLAASLRRDGTTLLHGDLWVTNLAIVDGRTVLLDWGLATDGPPVLDFVIFLTGCASQIQIGADDFVDLVRRAGVTQDAAVFNAAFGWGIAELGWNKALDATEHPDPDHRDRERDALLWWCARARAALDAGLL